MKSWRHQDIAIERFKDKERIGLLFDCGKGKTRTAIKIAEEKDMPVLVICPKALTVQWADAIHEHGEVESDIFVFSNAKKNTKKFQEDLDAFLNR